MVQAKFMNTTNKFNNKAITLDQKSFQSSLTKNTKINIHYFSVTIYNGLDFVKMFLQVIKVQTSISKVIVR